MTQPLTPATRAAIDAHLDAIEQVLIRASMSREPRRNVTDNVETQILDMLAARCAKDGDRSATAEDVAAVLGQLDPPSAYAPNAPSAPPVMPPAPPRLPAGPRMSRLAVAGAVCIALSLLAMCLILPLGLFVGRVQHMTVRPALLEHTSPLRVTIPAMTSRSVRSSEPLEHTSPLRATIPPALGPATTLPGPSPAVPAGQIGPGERWIMATTLPGPSPAVPIEHSPAVAATQVWSSTSVFVPDPAYAPTRSWAMFGPMLFGCPVILLALAGTLLGWIAFFQIRASRGRLTGTPLALFDGLFYPVLTLCTIPFFIFLA